MGGGTQELTPLGLFLPHVSQLLHFIVLCMLTQLAVCNPILIKF